MTLALYIGLGIIVGIYTAIVAVLWPDLVAFVTRRKRKPRLELMR